MILLPSLGFRGINIFLREALWYVQYHFYSHAVQWYVVMQKIWNCGKIVVRYVVSDLL